MPPAGPTGPFRVSVIHGGGRGCALPPRGLRRPEPRQRSLGSGAGGPAPLAPVMLPVGPGRAALEGRRAAATRPTEPPGASWGCGPGGALLVTAPRVPPGGLRCAGGGRGKRPWRDWRPCLVRAAGGGAWPLGPAVAAQLRRWRGSRRCSGRRMGSSSRWTDLAHSSRRLGGDSVDRGCYRASRDSGSLLSPKIL